MKTIRIAKPQDAASILEIYAPYILNTSFTFETELPAPDSFAQRIITYTETWPWLICEIDGTIAGYAYATRHRERLAYQWCVESSVYIHDNFMGTGMAPLLYNALFKLLKHQGFVNVYAGITLPNDRSVAFHKGYGFSWLTDYNNIGYKMGKWNTVSWWQKQINEYLPEPSAPIAFSNLDLSIIDEVLNENK